MPNSIYESFQTNKQLFKPFVKWPERVHLGLNNVDAISNSLLKAVKLEKDEHVLWICKHKATYCRSDNDENRLKSDGVIVTDKCIYYVNITKSKESFCIDWSNVATIIHQMNCFYIQRSLTDRTYGLKISDYAMLGEKVENDCSVVSFFREVAEDAAKGNAMDFKSTEKVINNTENLHGIMKGLEESKRANAQLPNPKMAKSTVNSSSNKASDCKSKEVKTEVKKTRRTFL